MNDTIRQCMWSGSKVLLLATCSLLFAACDFSGEQLVVDLEQRITDEQSRYATQPEITDIRILRFGFDTRASIEEDARQYLPFLDYLERATGYRFQLHFTEEDGDIIDDLGRGDIHFAAIGAGSYLLAQHQYDVLPLVRGRNTQGRAEYSSCLVIAPNSAIDGVPQLRGKRIAFGSTTSTQGHLIPRVMLREAGIRLADLAAYRYTGSHHNCANAVISGEYDACGLQDTLADSLAAKGLVRILARSDYYPSSGISAYGDVDPAILERVRQALLDFDPAGKHSQSLYHWHRTEMPLGFIVTKDEDYHHMRHWALEFGLLPPMGKKENP
ncbi:MAG: phosphate/phosphite/phosphonate ABC transporter substrate-binding protein [Candidatus Sedimenticola sp. (ex Thyasira tokunagai)]